MIISINTLLNVIHALHNNRLQHIFIAHNDINDN